MVGAVVVCLVVGCRDPRSASPHTLHCSCRNASAAGMLCFFAGANMSRIIRAEGQNENKDKVRREEFCSG